MRVSAVIGDPETRGEWFDERIFEAIAAGPPLWGHWLNGFPNRTCSGNSASSSMPVVVRSRGGGLKYEKASMTFRTGIEWTTEEVYLMVDVSLVFSHACKTSAGVNALSSPIQTS